MRLILTGRSSKVFAILGGTHPTQEKKVKVFVAVMSDSLRPHGL